MILIEPLSCTYATRRRLDACHTTRESVQEGDRCDSTTGQHRHGCGIDLHARTKYVCILDSQGEALVHENLKAKPEAFLEVVTAYREGLVVAVECIYTWHWLGDLCAKEGIAFVLGHALYSKAIHGGLKAVATRQRRETTLREGKRRPRRGKEHNATRTECPRIAGSFFAAGSPREIACWMGPPIRRAGAQRIGCSTPHAWTRIEGRILARCGHSDESEGLTAPAS